MALVGATWCVVNSIWTAPVRYTDEQEAAHLLAFCLGLSIIAFPLLLQMARLVLWLCPLTYKHLQALRVTRQTYTAWSALVVFAVDSIAAASKLDRVSQWIMNATYPGVCGLAAWDIINLTFIDVLFIFVIFICDRSNGCL